MRKKNRAHTHTHTHFNRTWLGAIISLVPFLQGTHRLKPTSPNLQACLLLSLPVKTQWTRCLNDQLTSISRLSHPFHLFLLYLPWSVFLAVPPPPSSLQTKAGYHIHEAARRKREQGREKKPHSWSPLITYRSSFHLQLCSKSLQYFFQFSLPLCFLCLVCQQLSTFKVLLKSSLCRRACVCAYSMCVCVTLSETLIERLNTLHYIMLYGDLLWMNGEWGRQKHCVCLLTVNQSQRRHSHCATGCVVFLFTSGPPFWFQPFLRFSSTSKFLSPSALPLFCLTTLEAVDSWAF